MRKDSTARRRAPPLAGLLSQVRERPIAAALAVLLLALAIQAALKHGSEWNDVYVRAGQRLLAGEPLYGPGSNYVYPPFTALVAAAFAFLPPMLSRAIWFVLNGACLVALLCWSWMLSRGPALDAIRRWSRADRIAALLGLACGATYLLNSFAHQQIDVVIAALLVGGCLELSKARDIRAGLLIGLAAACKATPLLLLPYLLWRRRWNGAIAAAVLMLGVNLAPDVLPGPETAPRLLVWATQVVAPAQRPDAELGIWYSDILYNQSLGGTLQRLVNTTLSFDTADGVAHPAPRVDAVALKIVCYAALALLFAASIVLAGPRASGRRAADPGLPDRVTIEFSVVLMLMLLASPMSSSAHFGVLLLPGLCVARAAVRTGDRVLWTLLACAALLSILRNGDLVGDMVHTLLLWSGSVTVVTLLLWIGSMILLRRLRDPGAPIADNG